MHKLTTTPSPSPTTAQQRIVELEAQLAHAQASEQRLTQLLNYSLEGMILLETDGSIGVINDALAHLLDLPTPASQWVGHPMKVFCDSLEQLSADPDRLTERAADIWRSTAPVVGELLPLRDGRVLQSDIIPISTEAGQQTLLLLRDVTTREQTAAALRSISRIPDQNPNPILRLDSQGEKLYENPAAVYWQTTLPADEVVVALTTVRDWGVAALAAGEPQQHLIAVAGHEFQSFIVPFPADGYVNLYFLNVTEQRRAERQVAEQRAFYEDLLDQLPVEVVVLDEQQRYRYANPQAVPDVEQRAWLLGHTVEEYCACYGIDPVLVAGRAAHFAAAQHTDAALPLREETAPAPNGTLRHFERSFRRLRTTPGQPALTVGYGLDVTARRQMETQVAEQRAFYESVLHSMPSQIAVFDPTGRYLFINAQALPNAADRDALRGQTVDAFVARQQWPAALAAERRAHYQQAVAEGRQVVWQEATAATDGQLQHFLRHYQPVFSLEGTLQFVIAYGTDITARVQAEERLRAQEEQLREQQQFMQLVLDTSPSVIYVRDGTGATLFANYAMRQLQEPLSQLDAASLPEAQRQVRDQEQASYARLDAEVLTTGRVITAEDRLTLPDGSVRWYYTVKSPLPRPDGSHQVLGVSTDITELKQAQFTLERSEKQYRDLMHYAQAFICTYDLQGRVQSVNPALAALLGYGVDELLDTHVATYLLAEDQPHFAAYLQRIADTGEAEGVLRVVPRGHRQPRYLLYHNHLVLEAGQAPYVISHSQDITARIGAEQEAQRARAEAEATARARENFLANMSHEIRTPLNGVLGMAALLAKTRLSEEQRQQVQIIQASGQHLLGVINDVLDMAKISSGKLELERVAFNLCDSVQQAVEPLALRAHEQGLAFRVEPLAAHCPWVLSDPFRLNQVLLNLLSNALKFTAKGSITLSGVLEHETDEALDVTFRVADTGIGIPADKLEHIFEDFTQAYADTTRRYGGTGLGLSISRALVAQLGSELHVDSVAGQGSTFWFTLTLQKTAAPIEEEVTQPTEAALAGLRVLLVEDNLINRMVARQMIGSWGGHVDEAMDGQAALTQFEAARYDVVLMDIQLPGLSGVEVTRRIRQHPDAARARTPILALTANAYQSDTLQYLAAGMDACLAKPIDERALFQALDALRPVAPARYDLSRFHAMAHGNADFVPGILRAFLADIPPALERVAQATAAADWPEVGRRVHYLKPNLEALTVADTADDMALLEQARHTPPVTAAEVEALLAAAQHLHATVTAILPLLAADLAALQSATEPS